MRNERHPDRRVRRTHELLHGALASLVHEKPYDAIVVKEILSRANVGRSTFYTHFHDKDDLLVSSIHDMLRACDAPPPARAAAQAEWLLRFSLPVLEHVERYSSSGHPPAEVRGQGAVHDRLRQVLVDRIAADLRRTAQPARQGEQGELPAELLADHVASTFILVLNWWLERRVAMRARAANDHFRALILPTLTGAFVR